MQMTNVEEGKVDCGKAVQLEERTGRLGKSSIAFAKRIPVNLVRNH